MKAKNKMNVFIVEDNELFALALKSDIENAFEKKAIQIHAFATGEKCMEKILVEKPQVVILDYNLNSKDANAANGIKVLDWIKKAYPETNVIMLTSEDHIDIAVKSFLHGASDYVVKTETKFKKINYSLSNLFKMMEAKEDARMYKYLVVGLIAGFTLLIGGVIVTQLFYPSFFRMESQ